jgi:hypothetical protein
MSEKVDSYLERARRHAPGTVKQVVEAARDMAARGYSDATIGEVLRLNLESVKAIVGKRDVA